MLGASHFVSLLMNPSQENPAYKNPLPIISIVVPCYNEEVSLPRFYDEITKTMHETKSLLASHNLLPKNAPFYELIFVNDGSKDRTLEILDSLQSKNEGLQNAALQNNAPKSENLGAQSAQKECEIGVFSFSRNFGKEAAILAGLQKARGEGVILLDADLQDPPNLIPQMIKIWLDSKREIKVIYARRTTRAGESKIRAALSEAFYKLSNWISEVKIESGVRDFRLMDREVIDALLEMKEYHRFSKAMFAWVGFKRECLEYEYIPHFKESSSWSFWKLFKYAIEGIVSFSTMPLRIAFVIGALISVFAVLYGIYRIIDTIMYGNPVPGYPSLIVVITFIGGIQLMLLGVIGEYIARIYEQVKMRPIYILESRARKNSASLKNGGGAVAGSNADSSSHCEERSDKAIHKNAESALDSDSHCERNAVERGNP
ncbi:MULTISPECIES: glycosyltransferase family 2 protein [unclassified Helicobacter]|uniref:glycosyltransferase family 2 protein n=1 Tax=unclassified Helicobacter TaxID=2593540 RepID=UPI001F173D4B|nr:MULTISPECIES: glycosyltransferase family 2 protein [unclassified Helicobacter]